MKTLTKAKLEGKVAVVTASTDGIGLAIARRLGENSAKVVVSSRYQNHVDKAVQTLKSEKLDVCGVVCDVANKDQRSNLVQKALDHYGRIDILVSNAAFGGNFPGDLLSCSEETWDKLFDINVKATFMLCKEVVPQMEKRGGGSIVIISSLAGYRVAQLTAAYCITKTTLLGITKGLVGSLTPKNIRVNCVAPGLIKTTFSEPIWSNKEILDSLLQNIPLKRAGTPDECSGIVSFLCSSDASFITGETIVVGGGMPSRL